MSLHRCRGLGTQGGQQYRRTAGKPIRNMRVDGSKTRLPIRFGPFGIRFEFVGGHLIRPNGVVGPVGPQTRWGHLRVIPPHPVVRWAATTGRHLRKKFHQGRKQPMTLQVHDGGIGRSI